MPSLHPCRSSEAAARGPTSRGSSCGVSIPSGWSGELVATLSRLRAGYQATGSSDGKRPGYSEPRRTNVAEMVAEELRREGYDVRYTLLNAAWYGVPQTRERMFLIGIHRELEGE